MPSRPLYRSRPTDSTMLSIADTTFSSTDHASTPSTALTSPDLCSPRKIQGRLEPMLETFEREQETPRPMDPLYAEETAGSAVSRGTSVKDRASQFEHQAQASSSRPRPLPVYIPRARSTSALRISRKTSGIPPSNVRRVPLPSTEPVERTAVYEPDEVSPRTRRTPPELKRGKGSAKRMIQQWESLPTTPAAEEIRPRGTTPMSARVMSRDYLDHKPLPVPQANPIPAVTPPHRYSPGRNPQSSPARTAYVPSPLQHLQTPTNTHNRIRSSTLTPSPSSHSLSPSPGEKRKKGGRSPLKEMLNVFGGGIQAMGRKAMGKGKEKAGTRAVDVFGVGSGEDPWGDGGNRLGTNGLPGGIVFSDRMGDQEMVGRASDDPNVIRTSAVMYLIPTPCSSLASWGSWLTSWATLTSHTLHVTYCPIFHNAQSGNSTPRRVLSGASPIHASTSGVPFSSIPPPEAGSPPDVELLMKDCVEVRSLRREEVNGRGVPAVPEGVGTEVLEMVWSDGSKRYLGVEGVGGRLGWVSAIWDVLLACKSQQPPSLPPPSPVVSFNHLSQPPDSSLASFPFPVVTQHRSELSDFNARIASLRARAASSVAPPIQKVGDTWVAASVLGTTDVALNGHNKDNALRQSVQRMFDTADDKEVLRRESEATERIQAWQPSTERELSIFSRSKTKRSSGTAEPISIAPYGDEDRAMVIPQSETVLSFDPNDLNPSRSASQVRRPSAVVGSNDQPRPYASRALMTVVMEGESDNGDDERNIAPTLLSHVTFPKPTLKGMPMMIPGGLPMVPSISSSSVETGKSSLVQTPQTEQSSLTTVSSADPAVLAKLESHSTEHGGMASQIDGVQVDIHRIISSLGALVQQAKVTPNSFPKALDDRISSLQLDVKGVENALQLSSLASNRQPQAEEPKLVEVHTKLDNIAKLCEDLLGKQAAISSTPAVPAIDGLPIRAAKAAGDTSNSPRQPGSQGLAVKPSDEKIAGEEVAQIMADLTGGSYKTSPNLGSIQVLHNVSAPSSPKPTAPAAMSEDAAKQVGEVLGLVKELKEARSLQTQQTTDIARYLNELNSWLEKFVLNSTTELSTMSKRLNTLVGPEGSADGQPTAPRLPDLVTDVHCMMTEQKHRNETEGMVGQRLDSLLQLMGQERERQASQQTTAEHVLAILDRQRNDNEVLLRALATDLTGEIRGERIRFVEAMQQATSVNVTLHIEEFKKLLSAEVHKSMKELGQMREQKKALEHQISDLFALKAKHGPNSGPSSRRESAAPTAPAAARSPAPQPGARVLPAPPAR